MVDIHDFIATALALGSKDWQNVFMSMGEEEQKSMYRQMRTVVKDKSESEEKGNIIEPSDDANEYFRRVAEALIDMKRKVRQTMQRLDTLERGGVATIPFLPGNGAADFGSSRKNFGSLISSLQKRDTMRDRLGVPIYEDSRKSSYRFGTANLPVLRPSKDYPSATEAAAPPKGRLTLEYAHGYQGVEDTARQNLHLVRNPDTGKTSLVYHLAGTAIVTDCADRTQKFFTEHNDDVTTVTIDPRPGSYLAASGQIDPKDSGEKDLPKIYLWDWRTMEKVALLDNAHWGSVLRVQFAYHGDRLYSMGGDDEHSMVVWDISPKGLAAKDESNKTILGTTTKEDIFGFSVCPVKSREENVIDEIVIYGRKKALSGIIQRVPIKKGSKRMELKLTTKQVLLSTLPELKKDRKLNPAAILSCKYCPNGQYVLGCNLGCFYLCMRNTPLLRIQAHSGYIGALVVTNAVIITAGADGVLKKWEYGVEDGRSMAECVWESPGRLEIDDHDFEFKPRAIAYDEQAEKIYVGSKTCQIMEYDFNNHDSREVIVDGHDGQIWGLATCPIDGFERYFLTGGYDHVVKLWDAETRKVVDTFEFPLPQGQKKGEEIHNCVWSTDGRYIACGTTSSRVYLLTWKEDSGGGRKLDIAASVHLPPKPGRETEEVAYLRFSPTGTELAVAHMDSNLYIFTLEDDEGNVKMTGWDPLVHRAAPTNIQWSADSKFMKTFTRDYEVVHYQIDTNNRRAVFYPYIPDPDDVVWDDDPLIAGWDTEGCFQKEWDGTDLNDVTQSTDGKLLFTGDDYGLVRVHNYPAVSNSPSANFRYKGHSAFVVGVEMCRDDEYLISCGGNDLAIFQWRLHKDYEVENGEMGEGI